MCLLSVKMPSRTDTLRWLGDDVTALSGKVTDILKLDASMSASPANSTTEPCASEDGMTASPANSTTEPRASDDGMTAEQVTFSDSFSPDSQHNRSLLGLKSPQSADDVDAVTDAVGRLTIEPAVTADVSDKPEITSAAAAQIDEDAAMSGAVAAGGRTDDSLLNMLAQFADDTVHFSVLVL